jgi:hypothetical protein
LLGNVTQRRLTQLPHGFWRQSPLPVGAPVEEALVEKRPLQLCQRLGVDRGIVTELARQHVQVDVVHRRARIALRQRLGQLLELRDVCQRLRSFAHAQRIVAGKPRRAGPVFARSGALKMRVQPVQRLQQRG